jgi:subtilisin-like proprotein convertase family protein
VSSQPVTAIPDFNSTGIVSTIVIDDARAIADISVHVNVDHPLRGDLQITLIAPDGTEVLLAEPSIDRSVDLVATFGRDVTPVQSLSILRGKPARGTWRLRVADTRIRDVGSLVSWGLAIRFEGDVPVTSRPTASDTERQLFPVVGSVIGVHGTRFTSDLIMTNPAADAASVDLIFTPSATDGRTRFASVRVIVAAHETIVLHDVIATLFRSAGTGQLELLGRVVATSEIVTTSDAGTSIEAVPSFTPAEAAGTGRVITLGPLYRNAQARSNAGFAEMNGGSGLVEVTSRGSDGAVSTKVYGVAPFSHLQFPVDGCNDCSLHLTMRVLSGDAAIVGYASNVENATGQATFVRGVVTQSTNLESSAHLRPLDGIRILRRP